MLLRRTGALFCLLLCTLAFPTNIELVFAGGKPVLRTTSCHDGVWDDGEYCGRDAYVTTLFPEMNHDCLIDGLDVGLFLDELYTSGSNLSADFNDDNQVDVFNDYFIFAPKVGSDVYPCNGSPTPTVHQGTLSLSASPNPQTIVSSPVLTPGQHDLYVVLDGFSNAKYVEYAIWTPPNVFIVADSMTVPGLSGPSCNTGTYNVVHSFETPLISGPVTINRITVDVTQFVSASLTIAPANCSWAKVRWARAAANVSFECNVQNLGINQPGTYGTVTGKAFMDVNGDCVYNAGDVPIAERLVVTSPGSYGAATDANGDYALNAPPGNYTVTFAPVGNDPWKFSICQGPYDITVTAGNTVVGKDFGLAPYGTVSGKVFRNLAFGTCSFDPPIDNVMPGRVVVANPGGYKTMSNSNGDYSMQLPVGSYDIQYQTYPNDAFVAVCQPSPTPVVVTANTNSPNHDISLQRTGPPHCGTKLDFYVYGPVDASCPSNHKWMTSWPGHDSEYDVVLRIDDQNTFAASASSTLDIQLDPKISISDLTCDWPYTVIGSAGPNQRTVRLDDPLWPGLTVVVKMHAHPTSADGPYHSQVTYDDLGFCDGVKTTQLDELTFCACDPNDMKVIPEGCGQDHEVVGDQPFAYTIRFENMGSGSAHNISIKDAIDPNLDINTLQVKAASHTVTGWQTDSSGDLTVSFDGINLPGTFTEDLQSRTGFVMFTINPLPGLPDGTIISNSAAITFDYNDPVITNTVTNKIKSQPCATTPVTPTVYSTFLRQNHPNPFNPMTTIEYGLASRSKVSIAIYNVNGQLVRTLVSAEMPAGQYSIEWDGRDQRGNLVASGVYLSRMRSGSYSETKKLLLLK